MQSYLNKLSAILCLLLLSGCATFSEDSGFNNVAVATKEKIGQEAKWVKSEADQNALQSTIQQKLQKSLAVEDAVQIALWNNRGLQANYAELGIAEADLVQVGRLPNPLFSFAKLKRGMEFEYERKIMFDVLSLITMPVASRIESRRFEQAKLRAVTETLQVADNTRRAFYTAIAAQETEKYMEQVKMAAEAGAELALRMKQVGNWSALQQAKEQIFYADATAQLARTRQMKISEREKLTRLLGLWKNEIQFQLPERLPDLPQVPQEYKDIETQALNSRIDIQMAKQELQGLADNLGLTKATRFINVLELGYMNNSETDKPRQTGYEIEISIPLFDWGSAKVQKAEMVYMQAAHRTAETAINARSEVRETYHAYLTAYDLAKHYRDEVVPLRKKISDENLLRYNGMLIGVFELLADAREQIAGVNAYIEALRDFWVAESALQMVMVGKSVSVSIARTAGMEKNNQGGH